MLARLRSGAEAPCAHHCVEGDGAQRLCELGRVRRVGGGPAGLGGGGGAVSGAGALGGEPPERLAEVRRRLHRVPVAAALHRPRSSLCERGGEQRLPVGTLYRREKRPG